MNQPRVVVLKVSSDEGEDTDEAPDNHRIVTVKESLRSMGAPDTVPSELNSAGVQIGVLQKIEAECSWNADWLTRLKAKDVINVALCCDGYSSWNYLSHYQRRARRPRPLLSLFSLLPSFFLFVFLARDHELHVHAYPSNGQPRFLVVGRMCATKC